MEEFVRPTQSVTSTCPKSCIRQTTSMPSSVMAAQPANDRDATADNRAMCCKSSSETSRWHFHSPTATKLKGSFEN